MFDDNRRQELGAKEFGGRDRILNESSRMMQKVDFDLVCGTTRSVVTTDRALVATVALLQISSKVPKQASEINENKRCHFQTNPLIVQLEFHSKPTTL